MVFMRRRFLFLIILILIAAFIEFSGCRSNKLPEKPRTVSFNQGWRFIKTDPLGAKERDFDDSGWRELDLPHDWSIEDLPDQYGVSVVGPYDKASIGNRGTGYTVGGIGWYRKHFTIDAADQGKIAYLQFDGIYMNSDVWINGKHVGNHPYGYTSFWYDITLFLNPPGESNVVAVQVKNEGLNARWYSGSGIYRHTWLTFTNPVHVAPWGVKIVSSGISNDEATVEVLANIKNTKSTSDSIECVVRLLDPSGIEVGKSGISYYVPEGRNVELRQVIMVSNPALWSLENPDLYRASVEVIVDGKIVDNVNTDFGIRSIQFDSKKGFTLNDKPVLLKGGCFHHDNGPLGAVAIDRAEERKIEIFKKAGFNAIRCSHNPPSPYLLDVCDRLGMLVINEAFDMWDASAPETNKYNNNYYSKYFEDWWQKDLQAMLLRDRNHPSIIMWSIGNGARAFRDTMNVSITKNLIREVKKYDATRPVTKAYIGEDAELWLGEPRMDVYGYKYAHLRFTKDHEKYPDRIIYASEFMPPQALENWNAVKELPYVIGSFSWIAMDYLGEAGMGVPRLVDIAADGNLPSSTREVVQFFDANAWPMYVSFQGIIDLIGNPKPAYYYQQVVWGERPVEMFVHSPIPEGKKEITGPWGFPDLMKCWNWQGHEGELMQVYVYTRSKLVKLRLNGSEVGEQTVDSSRSIAARFEVPYEPGILTVSCYDEGVETASETIRTAGKPASIRLSADRTAIKADRNDLCYVMVEIVDDEGVLVANADDLMVNFEISGNGEIAGVGSGSPTDISSFQQPRKKTWHGRCLAIVRPRGTEGQIFLTAKAEGLVEAAIEIITHD
jgi:beta-galactosidase